MRTHLYQRTRASKRHRTTKRHPMTDTNEFKLTMNENENFKHAKNTHLNTIRYTNEYQMSFCWGYPRGKIVAFIFNLEYKIAASCSIHHTYIFYYNMMESNSKGLFCKLLRRYIIRESQNCSINSNIYIFSRS